MKTTVPNAEMDLKSLPMRQAIEAAAKQWGAAHSSGWVTKQGQWEYVMFGELTGITIYVEEDGSFAHCTLKKAGLLARFEVSSPKKVFNLMYTSRMFLSATKGTT